MKKIFIVICMLLMIGIPVNVRAEDYSGPCGDNLTWTLSGSTLTISGIGKMDEWDYTKDIYAPWYSYASSIKTIIVEDGVTSLGHTAFFHLGNVTKMSIPASVTQINTYAFSNMNAIKTIGPAGGGYNYEYGWTEKIPNFAFSGFYECNSIVIKEGITAIPGSMATWCTSLTSVTLPSTIESIGGAAFYKCSSLKQIKIPRKVASVGATSFSGCNASLKAILECGSPLTDEALKTSGVATIVRDAHTIEFVDEVGATCEEDGVKEHYHCTACDGLFEDLDATTQLSEEDLVINKLGHDYVLTETINPTCTEKGSYIYTCQNNSNHTYTEDIDPLGHDLVYVEEVKATETTPGCKGYYECQRCHERFEDADGTILIEDFDVWSSKGGAGYIDRIKPKYVVPDTSVKK